MSAGPTRVLAALRRAEGRPCSGEQLSLDLGVTRAQVWKHVEGLRSRGYQVDGTPGGGYRLAALPDRLYPEEIDTRLQTRWLAREVRWLETTDSSNRVASEWARDAAPHGACVVVEGQTAGRGRLGRQFFSPAHVNLYTSLVLRPTLHLAQAPTIILAAAVAVADTVAAWLPQAPVEIKWPNDVQVGGRKISGILMESSAEGGLVASLVLGIGVNLNVDPAGFPDEFRARATSLRAELGQPVDRVGFACALYGNLEQTLDLHASSGFEALLPRFEARSGLTGRRVRVLEVGEREIEGVAEGIAADGALVLRGADGARSRVLAGDVTVAKEEVRA